VKIEDVELSVKGWNWGTAKFKGRGRTCTFYNIV